MQDRKASRQGLWYAASLLPDPGNPDRAARLGNLQRDRGRRRDDRLFVVLAIALVALASPAPDPPAAALRTPDQAKLARACGLHDPAERFLPRSRKMS